MFLTVGESAGHRLYLMRFQLDDTVVYKIGKASGTSSVTRMLQIIRDYFMKYRVTPIVSIKRDRPCADAFKIEADLHHHFSNLRYSPEKAFTGSTECFHTDEDYAVDLYERALAGEDIRALPPIAG